MDFAAALAFVVELIKYAPQIKDGAEDIIEGAKQVWAGLTAETPPTDQQQAEYDAALKAAHEALQNS
jgi:hypothetical protein